MSPMFTVCHAERSTIFGRRVGAADRSVEMTEAATQEERKARQFMGLTASWRWKADVNEADDKMSGYFCGCFRAHRA